MKNSTFISGLLLLATGVILLLTNLGVIDFSWRNSIRFWPLIIVYYGVSMVLPRNTTGRGLSTLFAIASIAFVIYVGVNAEAANRIYRVVDPFSSSNRLTERLIEKLDHLDSVEAFIDLQSTTTFPAEKMNASERAALFEQINYLKADLQFESHSVHLSARSGRDMFSAKTDGSRKKSLTTTYTLSDSIVNLVFKNEGGLGRDGASAKPVEVIIHPEKTYDLLLSGKNGEANLELSNASLRSVKLDWDRGDCRVSLPNPKGEIPIHSKGSGVDLQLTIPTGVAFRVEATNARELDILGVTRLENGAFQTPDFEGAKDRYLIRVESPKRLEVKQL